MEGGKGGGAGNYWPGFVDALTNVVIAMVFVIVVLAISLSFLMQLLAQRMAARIAELEQRQGAAARAVAAAPSVPSPTPAPTAVPKPPAPQARQVDQSAGKLRIDVAGNEDALSAQGGAVRNADGQMLLESCPKALTLDAAASAQFVQGLAPLKEALAAAAGKRVTIVASGPDLDLSENQRAAYIRVMGVRNVLLDQGIAAERITTRFDFAAKPVKATISILIEGPAS